MASMFLTGPLVDKLKGLAKEEIHKMLPEIKNKLFLGKARNGFSIVVNEKKELILFSLFISSHSLNFKWVIGVE